MKKSLLLLMATVVVGLVYAELTPSWTAKFNSEVEWQRVTNLGYLIVNNAEGLHGLNPESGEIMWALPQFKSIPEASFQQILKTEFFSISIGEENPVISIIDPISGTILFNSKEENVKTVLSKHPIGDKLLLVCIKEGESTASLLMYDINSKKQLWSNDEMFKVEAKPMGKGKFGALMGNIASQVGSIINAQSLVAEPVVLDQSTVILLHPNFVYKVNSENGDLAWKFPIQSSTRAKLFVSPDKSEILYVSTEVEEEMQTTGQDEPTITFKNITYAVNLADGKSIWDESYEAKGHLNTIILDQRGLIVCPASNNPAVNLVDYSTGIGQWGKKGKGNKMKGSIVSSIPLDGKYIVTTAFDNAWNNKAEEYFLNILDPETGLEVFEKSEKLKGDLVKTELLEKGLLYITSQEVNILDIKTGINIFEKSVQAAKPLDPSKYDPMKHGLPIADNDKELYVFSSKENLLYRIDKSAATAGTVTSEKIEFEGKEEPTSIELVDDGIIISSDQNIMKLDKSGNKIYHTYLEAPKLPGIMRALHAANALRAAYIGAAASMYSAAFDQAAAETDDEVGKEVAEGFSEGFGELANEGFAVSGESMDQMRKRFKATAQSPDYVFILSEYENRRYGLYQINKVDGQKLEMIDMFKDREPIYEVDQIYSYIYYRNNPNEIACYKFK